MNMLSLLIACAALCACGGETAGRVIDIHLRVQPEAEPGRELGEFTTDTGWEVELDEATLAIGSMYAFAPASGPGAMAWLSDLLVPVAHAHGGFDPASGLRARAELLEPVAIDLLAADGQELSDVEAEAGALAKLALDIAKPDADLPEAVHGHQAWVAGEATRGAERVRFEGGLDIPDEGLKRRIETEVEGIELEDGGTLVLSLRPSRWLHDANFDRLAAPAEGEPAEITRESQVGRAWLIGARSPAVIHVNWQGE